MKNSFIIIILSLLLSCTSNRYLPSDIETFSDLKTHHGLIIRVWANSIISCNPTWDIRICESDTTMIKYMRGTVLRRIPLKIGLRIDKKFNVKYPLIPKRDWNYFLSQIDSLKILQLPTQKSIPNYEETPILDGDWYTIEIKDLDGTLRKLDYLNPAYDKPDYWESKYVVRFIDILQNDFKLKK